jgi:hypothetical protein
MPTIPATVNDLYEVRVDGAFTDIITENVWHFKAITPGSDVEIGLILVLINCYFQHLAPGMSNLHSWWQVVWKRIYPSLSNEFITPFNPIATGGVAGDRTPSFCSALLSLRTAFGGRSMRGRKYISGLPEVNTTGDNIATESPTWAAILAFVQCLATGFIGLQPVGTDKYALGVFSRKIGGSTSPVNPAGFTPLTQIIPHTLIATTRSRKAGRGI